MRFHIPRRDRARFAAAAVVAVGVAVRLYAGRQDLAVTAAWTGLLLAVTVIAIVAVRSTGERLKHQSRRTTAIAIAAQRVGLAIDINEVAAAVLVASHEVFAAADFGGVLVFDHATEKLTPLPVSMQAGLVSDAGSASAFDLSPGEGVAGKVFLAAEARFWGTPAEVLAEHGTLRDITREQILALTGGMRSVAAAPLKLPDRGVIGVLTLGSTSREHVWNQEDMVVLQGLAEQAALGVERARMYQEQRAQAMTDPLTGLANYRQLKNVINQEVARARRADGRLALIFTDLDGFKAVNDHHGHRAGDGVLKLLARSMAEVLRAEDLAARYGGDEFVCVLPGADRDQADQVCTRIGRRFNELLDLDDELRLIRTSPSSGCAVFPEQGASADELLVAADSALMKAKRTTPSTELGR
ncbi:MAG TPA: diguanylate cyclase [Candidatus Dormibacteraeota bacterium]|nr:diguanylate cyclase [Candidatus Dormibacteraeota bacterium]